MKYPKIAYIADSHYDFLLGAWRKHCPQIFRKPQLISSFDQCEFLMEKIEHFDIIIFHDAVSSHSRRLRYELDMRLVSRAIEVSQRVDEVWYVGNRTFRQRDNMTTHPLWRIEYGHVRETDQLIEMRCRFQSYRLYREGDSTDRFFDTIDWRPLVNHSRLLNKS